MDKLLILYPFFFLTGVFCPFLKITSMTTQYIFNEHYPYFSNTVLIVHLFFYFSLKPVSPTIFCSIQLFLTCLKSYREFTTDKEVREAEEKHFALEEMFEWEERPFSHPFLFLPEYCRSSQ